jgi:hypothetical protein
MIWKAIKTYIIINIVNFSAGSNAHSMYLFTFKKWIEYFNENDIK